MSRNSLTLMARLEIPWDFQPPVTHLCLKLHVGPAHAPVDMSAGPPVQALLGHIPHLSVYLLCSSVPSARPPPVFLSQGKAHHPPSCLSQIWEVLPVPVFRLFLAIPPITELGQFYLQNIYIHRPPILTVAVSSKSGCLWPKLPPNWSLCLPWHPE